MRRYSLMGKQRKITATKQRKTLMAIKTNGKPRVWAIKPIMAGPASKEKARRYNKPVCKIPAWCGSRIYL